MSDIFEKVSVNRILQKAHREDSEFKGMLNAGTADSLISCCGKGCSEI
jgi:hypothetical protein